MKLKKIIAAVLSAATVLSLAGCGKEETSPIDALNSNPSKTSSAANSKSSAANSTPSAPESSAPESSVPEEPEATNVLYAQGEMLDFPETPVTDFDYKLDVYYDSFGNEENVAYIEEYFGKDPDVRIPEMIEGRRVVLETAFEDHGTIQRLIIPDGMHVPFLSCESLESVTFLGGCDCYNSAFSISHKLSNVYFGGVIPEGKTLRGAFSGTSWLEKINAHNGLVVIGDTVTLSEKCTGDIVVPKGVTKIANEAFMGAQSLTGVKLPEGVKEIGSKAFSQSGLKSINISEGVTSIGSEAFASTGLTDINISESVDFIGANAFNNTPYLEGLYNDEKLAIDGKWLLDGSKAYGHVTVPDGVTHIVDSAFSKANMQNVILPDGLVSIGDYAFYYAQFKDITVPDSVAYVGNYAFQSSSLFGLDEYKDANMVVMGKTAVIGYIKEKNKTVIIPDGVESISFSYAATSSNAVNGSNCNYMEKLILPDSFSYFDWSIVNSAYNIIYKGKTYSRWDMDDCLALKAAIEGN